MIPHHSHIVAVTEIQSLRLQLIIMLFAVIVWRAMRTDRTHTIVADKYSSAQSTSDPRM